MKPHIIESGQLDDFVANYEALLAQSRRVRGGKKSLKADLFGNYKVRDGEEVVFVGSLSDAIDAYNDLY